MVKRSGSGNKKGRQGKGKRVVQANHLKADKISIFREPVFLALVLLILTAISFIPSLGNGFINTWDDNVYLTDNLMIRHLDLDSLKLMFTTPVNRTYVPLPLLSFAVEYHFFGLDPVVYHFTNLLLHLACTWLVFRLLCLLYLDPLYAAFGALLFGIHPMHVESVAWITERKDLLFALFFLSSLISYIHYIRKNRRRIHWFILCLFFFLLSLFSKIQAVTLTLSLFLVDYYLQRPVNLKLIIEKIPFIILSLVFGIGGILILQRNQLESFDTEYSIVNRLAIGLYSLSAYLFRFFAPVGLSASYPYPPVQGQTLPFLFYLNVAFWLMLGYLVYRSVRFTRVILFGSLFFIVNIVFLLQVFKAGHAYMADRFSYLPYLGLIFMAVWYLEYAGRRMKDRKALLVIPLALIGILLSVMTHQRCKSWKDDETLWTDVLEKYPEGNAIAWNNHGLICENSGRLKEALADYSNAVEIDPGYSKAFYNKGNIHIKLGQQQEAIESYSRAIRINPWHVQSYFNRGLTYLFMNQYEKAEADFSAVINIDPTFKQAVTLRDNARKMIHH